MPNSQAWRHEIEPWFLRHGLPYFVDAERARARAALRPRRSLPWLVLVVLAAVGAAVGLTWLTGQGTWAPASLTIVGLVAALLYAVTALRARPILTWALRRTFQSARQLVPMVARALPLLLLFVTFLFINGEAWQLAAHLDGSVLWLSVLLFAAFGVLFLVVRLPDEVDAVDDHLDRHLLLRATRGTPLADATEHLVAARGDDLRPERFGEVPGWERRNLILVLLVTQVSQVLLLSLSVFAFFLLFGGLVMDHAVQSAWVGEPVHSLRYLDNLSVELVQVSVFLAAFSGLYFTVGVLTDETYRVQFFSTVLGELERAVGVRAAHLALREDSGEALPDDVLADEVVADDGLADDVAAEEVSPGDVPAADVGPAPEPAPEPGTPVAHWGFTQERADDISDGIVTGELALHRDGRLLRRYGGPSFRNGQTRWDFGPWHDFTGWRPEPDETTTRWLLVRRGYDLTGPGPLGVGQSAGGPYPGPPEPARPLPPPEPRPDLPTDPPAGSEEIR